MPRQKKGKTHQQIVDGSTVELNLIDSQRYVIIIISRDFLIIREYFKYHLGFIL